MGQQALGFGCRVSQGGTKTFILKHRNRRITLGRYPVLSLADARDEAKRILAEFTLGRLRPQPMSMHKAIELFTEEKSKSNRSSTVASYERLLEKHFPFTGQLTDVSHNDVVHRLNRLKTTPAEYNHALMGGKPGGFIRLLEYVRPQDTLRRIISYIWQPWIRWAYGASFDRHTEQYVPTAGLELLESRYVVDDLLKLITARVPYRGAV